LRLTSFHGAALNPHHLVVFHPDKIKKITRGRVFGAFQGETCSFPCESPFTGYREDTFRILNRKSDGNASSRFYPIPISGERKEIFANFLAGFIIGTVDRRGVGIGRFFVRHDIIRLDVIRLDIVGRGVIGGRGVISRVAFGPFTVLATASGEEKGAEGNDRNRDRNSRKHPVFFHNTLPYGCL